ncbi:MAG: molybdopterin synthase sulfur carrier subunit [Alkaliphilus sp.]|nr:MoaD/ThiS family protein [bacterium AH-315-G05]MBN4074384.1 MoaD/ThiS family protein [bacterium AH-315-E09]PHS31563.1 MAG: molybdopterin synthase sulfur carrier subunit [Alkaliphilus sp.]
MSIEVRLFATLREGRDKKIYVDYEEGLNGNAIVEKLNIPKDEVAIFLVNGRDLALDKELKENDVISIFPPVGGG